MHIGGQRTAQTRRPLLATAHVVPTALDVAIIRVDSVMALGERKLEQLVTLLVRKRFPLHLHLARVSCGFRVFTPGVHLPGIPKG